MGLLKIVQDYMKKDEKSFQERTDNFKGKIGNYIEKLGVTSEQVDALVALLDDVTAANVEKAEINRARMAITLKCRSLHRLGEKSVREFRRLIMRSPNCNDETLEDLGLKPGIKYVETDEQSPTLSVKRVAGVPQLRFDKSGFDGIRLFTRRGDEKTFDQGQIFTQPKFNDNTPRIDPFKPETREYYAYYVIKDKIEGKRSNLVKIELGAIV